MTLHKLSAWTPGLVWSLWLRKSLWTQLSFSAVSEQTISVSLWREPIFPGLWTAQEEEAVYIPVVYIKCQWCALKIISEINTQVSVLWQEVAKGIICMQKNDLRASTGIIDAKSIITIDLGIISLDENKILSSKIINWSIAGNSRVRSLHQRCLRKVFWSFYADYVPWCTGSVWFALCLHTDSVLKENYPDSLSISKLVSCVVFRELYSETAFLTCYCVGDFMCLLYNSLQDWLLFLDLLLVYEGSCNHSLFWAFVTCSELTSISWYCPFIGTYFEPLSLYPMDQAFLWLCSLLALQVFSLL